VYCTYYRTVPYRPSTISYHTTANYHTMSEEGSATATATATATANNAKLVLAKALEVNTHCCDCGDRNPTWVSLTKVSSNTLAAFCCYSCASQHRSLGTHISRVKSCSLNECKSVSTQYSVLYYIYTIYMYCIYYIIFWNTLHGGGDSNSSIQFFGMAGDYFFLTLFSWRRRRRRRRR
jgi:hypothetical protein